MEETGRITLDKKTKEPDMPKKDIKLIQLSEKVHITVEEIKNLGVENLDHMFLEIYTEQASQLTDSRQQKKVKHPLRVVVGIELILHNRKCPSVLTY